MTHPPPLPTPLASQEWAKAVNGLNAHMKRLMFALAHPEEAAGQLAEEQARRKRGRYVPETDTERECVCMCARARAS